MARIPLGIETDSPASYQTRLNNREKKVVEATREDRNIEDTFRQALLFSHINKDSGAVIDYTAEPAAGQEYTWSTGTNQFETHIAVIESSGTAAWSFPTVSADGLELTLDGNATDGITGYEIGHGILSTNKTCYTVGSFEDQTKRIFLEATIKIDDISDLTFLWFGWRKAEAYQVDPDNYDEMACFKIGVTDDGRFSTATILNNAATTVTDTTLTDWADAATYTLRVEINNAGQVFYKVDGTEPTVVAAFTFDAAEKLVPFLHLTNETGDPGVSISSWKVGFV